MKSFISLLLAFFVSMANASDPEVPRVAATDGEAIRKLVGQRAVVFGKVERTDDYQGKMAFINFSGREFTAMVFARNYERFEKPPEELLRGKYVEIIGIIAEYKGKLQIVLDGPQQLIKVEDPTSKEKPEPKTPGQSPEKPKEAPGEVPEVVDPGQFFGE